MTPPLFHLTLREQRPAVVVEVSGEVEVTGAAQFVAAIDAVAGPRPLIVDLSGLDYIDSAGFAAVDRLLDRAAIVVVLDPHSPIRAAAKLIELPFHDTVEDALGERPG